MDTVVAMDAVDAFVAMDAVDAFVAMDAVVAGDTIYGHPQHQRSKYP